MYSLLSGLLALFAWRDHHGAYRSVPYRTVAWCSLPSIHSFMEKKKKEKKKKEREKEGKVKKKREKNLKHALDRRGFACHLISHEVERRPVAGRAEGMKAFL